MSFVHFLFLDTVNVIDNHSVTPYSRCCAFKNIAFMCIAIRLICFPVPGLKILSWTRITMVWIMTNYLHLQGRVWKPTDYPVIFFRVHITHRMPPKWPWSHWQVPFETGRRKSTLQDPVQSASLVDSDREWRPYFKRITEEVGRSFIPQRTSTETFPFTILIN